MFSSRISRCIRPYRFFCQPNRSFCQQKNVSNVSNVSNVTNWSNVSNESKALYNDYLPIAISLSFICSLFSTQNVPPEDSFLEFFISSATVGFLVGVIYPISFPLITLNVLRKKFQRSSKPSTPENKQS